MLSRALLRIGHGLTLQILLVCSFVCITLAFMNNIGALALFMPVAVHVMRKAGHAPSHVLMPLAFSSLLGGLITMIGTPSNLIIAGYRRGFAGVAFGIFDFAPVGVGVAIAGVAFLVLVGWRLLPRRDTDPSAGRELAAWVFLGATLAVTMLLSAVINNAATVVLMAPVGIGIALRLDVSVDPFLMAIAVGPRARS